MSFLVMEAKTRVKKDNKLLKINLLIDWSKISGKLKNMYRYEINGKGGQTPYDSLKMFKAILLGQWHNLSDPGLEEALSLRLDFLLFTGFEGEVPDETTLCRFRNRLIESGLDKILFEEINKQLKDKGLMLKEAHGAVIDATLIESSNRAKKVINISEDRQEKLEPEDELIKCERRETELIEYSKDKDARWLKKGKRSYFGYKGFVSVDSKHGFIESVHVKSANTWEAGELPSIIKNLEVDTVYADKGYALKDNSDFLKSKKIRNGIMNKASRGHVLSKRKKQRNKAISKLRYIVERCFGTLKRSFNFNRASYAGRQKVEAQFIFKAICFNLLKAGNMVLIGG